MPEAPSSVKEPVVENTREEATKKTVEVVATMSHKRLDKLVNSRKFLKAASSFPTYNCAQAFAWGANDIHSVSIS